MLVQTGVFLATLLATANSQAIGKEQTETHPKMTWKKCTGAGSCTTVNGEVAIDANWRWLHGTSDTKNCYDGNKWTDKCSSATDCASKCALEGATYDKTYGAKTSGDALTLKFITKHEYGTNIGSRFYLLNGASKYQMFTLMNNEFTFDVDLSTVDCGLNAALYFVAMEEDGGMKKYSTNKAGAKYGTGYCDAQCPRDMKFINGEGNVEGWKPSSNDANAGVGGKGSCCAEMDIWEANSVSTAVTPHACSTIEQSRCDGDSCGGTYSADRYAGVCDPDGCDFNSYRMGVKDFYGKGKTVDTSKKFTVVTQFIGTGDAMEIKRFYVQGGKTIPQPNSAIEGVEGNSITTKFCDAQKKVFGDTYTYKDKGGQANMAKALAQGMVLVMSLWDDHYSNMLWLDSTYPTDKDAATPGIGRGECDITSGAPADVESKNADASVTYSNIKFGPINSTFG